MHAVQCRTGAGIKLDVDAQQFFDDGAFDSKGHKAVQRDLRGIFAAARETNRLRNRTYLERLADEAGVRVRSSQATSASEVTACGCALHYPDTPRDWEN